MSRCVEKLPHSCGSSDGLQVFEEDGKFTGYCYACSKYVASPYEDKPADYRPTYKRKTEEEIKEELDEIASYPVTGLPTRKLKKEYLDYFGVKVGVSQTDGETPEVVYFPYDNEWGERIGYKARLLEPKKMWAVGTTREAAPFGWRQALNADGKKLFITEGECFTPDTEVLTRDGWVSLGEYSGQDVMQVTSESLGNFVEPLHVVDKQFDGELIEYSSGSYYSLTTPKHNLVRVKDGELVKTAADDSSKTYLNIPRTLDGCSDVEEVNPWLLKAQVMFSADFTFRKDGDLYASFKKERKVLRAKEILDALGVRYVINKGLQKFSVFVHRGHGLPVSKLFDMRWLHFKNSRVLLEELVHWDGNLVPNRKQFEYSSKELHNATFVQTLAHLNGFVSTIIERSNQYGRWYKVSVLLGKRTSSTQNGFKKVPYSGRVMCLTVPSGMLLVRQQGSISISGNCDAIALFQVLKENNKGGPYADRNVPVISLPSGSGSVKKTLSKYRPLIEKHFKEVVLVFDMDKAGRLATEEALKILPNALVAELPEKDMNDCVIAGKNKQAMQALVFKSAAPKNTRLVNGKSLHEKSKKPPEWGLPWPWAGVNEITRGIRTGETIYIGAGQKMGKSELVDQLAAHFITQFDWKVFLAKPEQSNEETYKRILSKVARYNFVDPKIEFKEDLFDEAGEIVGDKVEMLDLYQHVSWETLQMDIRSAAANGCKAVFIDPITNLTNGLDAAAANVALQKIAQDLSSLALDLDILILIFCHLRNPEAGPDHSNGGKVLASQFAGSRAMARSCHLMLGLEGNKDPSLDESERNIRYLVGLENRVTGETGRWPLYWDRQSTIFTEMK